jgi:hypothetical protein
MTDARRAAARHLPQVPAHIVVMLSATTAGYALTLAAVAATQATAEERLIAERAPAVGGIEDVASGHDALAARLDVARRVYDAAAGSYAAATSVLGAVDQQLADLAGVVSDIDGSVRKLPTSIHMPAVRVVTQAQAPATHATTGASGG